MDNTKEKKYLLVKILVPVLIILIVAGIWSVKAFQKYEDQRKKTVIETNPDFALEVTDNLDIEKLKSYNIPILLEFGSESCPPCRQMAPIIKALNEELRGKAIVKYVNVGVNSGLANGYPVYVIPTQVFIDGTGLPYNPENPDTLDMIINKDKSGVHTSTSHEGTITKSILLKVLKEMGMKE